MTLINKIISYSPEIIIATYIGYSHEKNIPEPLTLIAHGGILGAIPVMNGILNYKIRRLMIQRKSEKVVREELDLLPEFSHEGIRVWIEKSGIEEEVMKEVKSKSISQGAKSGVAISLFYTAGRMLGKIF